MNLSSTAILRVNTSPWPLFQVSVTGCPGVSAPLPACFQGVAASGTGVFVPETNPNCA
jgi:hypothetical protein